MWKHDTRILIFIVILCTGILNLVIAPPAFAVPPLPATFWGYVTLDNSPVADGTMVEAVVDGIPIASCTTQTYQGRSLYVLHVPADESWDPEAGQPNLQGRTVYFRIAGRLADQTAIWQSGVSIQLDLSAVSVTVTTTPTVTFTHTVTPTPSRTPTLVPSPSPSVTPSVTATATPTPSARVLGTVLLQGRPTPPHPSWSVDLQVSLSEPGRGNPSYSFALISDGRGQFELPAVSPGAYVARVKNPHTLQNAVPITLTAGANPINFGLLREGDANNDNFVTLVDFSILATTFGTCAGELRHDRRADFNEDGCVTIRDFSLLASNFAQAGDTAPYRDQSAHTRLSAGPVLLALVPMTSTVEVGQEFEIFVEVRTGDQQVDGVAAYVDFDPLLLRVVSITPGPALTTVIQNEYDNDLGRLNYAAGLLGGTASDTFPLLTVRFRALSQTAGAPITFSLLDPRRSDATLMGSSVLGHVENSLVIAYPPVSPTDTPTLTPTATASHTHTPSPSPSATSTMTLTLSPTATHTLTRTPSITPTSTRTATPTVTFTWTSTPSATRTPTSTPTASPTVTPSRTPTVTFSPSATASPSPSMTLTSTPTATLTPPAGAQTMVLQQGVNGYWGTEDTYISLWYPNSNYGGFVRLFAHSADSIVTLIRFGLPSSIPADATIHRAILSLYVAGRSAGEPMNALVYQLLRPWSAGQATWIAAQTRSNWSTAGANAPYRDRAPYPIAESALAATDVWVDWDITSLVQMWVGDPRLNYGVVIRGKGTAGVQYLFHSSEYGVPSLRPKLTILYSPPAPSPTSSPTITLTSTPSATLTRTFTPTATLTPSATSTVSPTPTWTASPTVPPIRPSTEWVNFYGQVFLAGGVPAPYGTLIDAYDIEGIRCGTFMVSIPGEYGPMAVYADDPATPEDEGARAGENILFRVNMVPAETAGPHSAVWTGMGDLRHVDLSVENGTDYEQIIVLKPGWNLIALHVQPKDPAPAIVFGPLKSNLKRVMAFDCVRGGLSFYPDMPPELNTLQTLDPYHGYWVYVQNAAYLFVAGSPVMTQVPISLCSGWNLVGFLPRTPLAVPAALDTIAGSYDIVLGWDEGARSFYANLPAAMNTLQALEPGRGYWIHMISSGILVYP